MFRYRKTVQHYRKTAKTKTTCAFCDASHRGPTVAESPYFLIIKNIFPYDVWEGHAVIEHLLLIPKSHSRTLGALHKEELQDFSQQLGYYDMLGYNIYARGHGSSQKSIANHQHTHLIKIDEDTQPMRGMFYLAKPYFLRRF